MRDSDRSGWPEGLPVVQMRVARPTDRLREVVAFYRDGLGLAEVGSFGGPGHAGYDGVMLGLPDTSYHLEFTQHEHGSPCPAPTDDNLLVFYIPDRKAIDARVQRFAAMGYHPVPSENPYWDERGAVTIPDPDGWRVVLMPTEGI
jgi:catechol 2,3-dioxygenase-like lactoylglutathione lyase family enzyme